MNGIYSIRSMKESHLAPSRHIFAHNHIIDRSDGRQSRRILARLGSIKNQPSARHAAEVVIKEIDQPCCRIVRLGCQRGAAHPLDPLIEGNDGGGGVETECVGQSLQHLRPWLLDRVVDVVHGS